MTQIDPRFRQMGKGARRRRRRLSALRGAIAAVALAGLAFWAWPQLRPRLAVSQAPAPEMVQVESQFDIAPVVRGDTFTDIPGDPIIIPPPDAGATAETRRLPAPPALAASGRVPGPVARVQLLDSALVPQDRQLVAALPSTREEFALFQAERGRERLTSASLALPAAQDASTGVLFLRDAKARAPLWRELVLEVARDTSVAALLSDNGFDAAAAARVQDRLQGQLSLSPDLPRGTVLALRWRPHDGAREVIQLSLYGPQGYLGSLALSAAGQLVASADAWADQPLMTEAMARADDAPPPQGRQRLLDVIYSAALRGDVPPAVIGEALALMSQVHDLDGFADSRDRLTLIYADAAADRPGAVLFVGVSGPSGDKACYVVATRDGFECYAPGARVRRAGADALLQPIGGVLSQRFVPGAAGSGRGQVVWTAPQGSPVLAVAAGRVSALGPDMVEITHKGGLVSRYLGLAPEVAARADVAQGAVIGRAVQPPGRTEPGLALLLTRDGKPVDPLPLMGGGAEVLASDSIETLIGHIIRVESGGDAAAKNPRSTATGLGQFIEGTWLRMMRSYRPDLVASLPARDLLDLRLDPALSRQMVRHLAQENEAFLRARGHAISAGRLYLAHFLGPGGADLALRADPAQSVESVMGGAVVSANPFLRNWTIAALRDWAERRMSGPGAIAPAPDTMPVRPLTAELRAYVAEMDRLRQHSPG